MGWHWENIRHDKEHRQEGINRKSDLPYASWQNWRWLRLHDKCRFCSYLSIYMFWLGYDKEQITASETLFWVGVEVFLINLGSGLKFSGRYLTTLRRQMVPCTSCWSRQTWTTSRKRKRLKLELFETRASTTGRRRPGPSLTSTPPKWATLRSSLRKGETFIF